MTRETFMKELAYLLQDIQDEDKQDAIQYYNDYFDEAGTENEADIIKELGSPERIAAIIRAEAGGSMGDGGEFTDSGYEDARFRGPHYQMEARNAGDEQKQTQQEQQSQQTHQNSSRQQPPRTSPLLKALLWVILIVVAAPFVLGIGGSVLGILAGLAVLLLMGLLALGGLTAGALLAGVVMIPAGIAYLFAHPLNGILTAGTGLMFLGAGALLLALCLVFYGRFIPFLFCSLINFISRLLHRGRRRA